MQLDKEVQAMAEHMSHHYQWLLKHRLRVLSGVCVLLCTCLTISACTVLHIYWSVTTNVIFLLCALCVLYLLVSGVLHDALHAPKTYIWYCKGMLEHFGLTALEIEGSILIVSIRNLRHGHQTQSPTAKHTRQEAHL